MGARSKLQSTNMAHKLAEKVAMLIATLLLFSFVIIPFGTLVVLSLTVLIPTAELLARLFRPDLSEIFTDTGSMFARDDIYTHPKINMVVHIIIQGEITLERLRSQFERCVLNHVDEKGVLIYRRLRQTWTQFCGYLFWKWNDNFDIRHHVRLYDYQAPHLRLPSPCSEEDIQRVTGGLIEEPFAKGTSPWELLLTPEYQVEGDVRQHFVVTLKMNHAMADGFSVLKLITQLFDVENAKVAVPKYPEMSLWQSLLRRLAVIILFPYIVTKLLLKYRDGRNALHLKGQLSHKHVTFFSDKIPVSRIKAIKNKHGTSYNAAVYSITCGGIARLMKEAGMETPNSSSCFVPFPLPGHPGGLTNHTSGIFFKFCPQTESAVERLEEITGNLKSVASAPLDPIVASSVVSALCLLPFALSRHLYSSVNSASIGLSNFPGPENVMGWQGTMCKDIINATGTPVGSTGTVGIMLSLMGSQRMGIVVDRTIFEGYKIPRNFNQLVNQEVQELLTSEKLFQG